MNRLASETTYHASPDEQMSEAVINAVACAEGVDPLSIHTPLYEAIDPDALDELFSRRRDDDEASTFQIRFTFHGYEINVRDDGKLVLAQE